MKRLLSKKRKTWNIIGAVLVLLPTAILLVAFTGVAIFDALQEWDYRKFNNHLQSLVNEEGPIIELTDVATPPFVDFNWQQVCVSDFYCGATHCDPYLWELVFKGNPGFAFYPVDTERFGNFYATEALQVPYCLERGKAVLVADKTGLRLADKTQIKE